MNKTSTLRWILRRIKKFIPFILLTSAINIVSSLTFIYLARLSKNVIDQTGSNGSKISLFVIVLFATVILQLICHALLSVINVRLHGRLTISLRNYMFSSVVRKKYPHLFDHHSGDLLNRFTSDIEQVVLGSVHIVPNVCAMLTKIIGGIWALVIQSYIFAIVIIIAGFVIPLIGRMISKRYKYLHKEAQRTEGLSRSFMQESFANIVVIKTFASETPILRKLNQYMRQNLKIKIKRNFISVVTHTSMSSIFTLGYYVILVWGASQIATGVITYGTLNYYLQLVSLLRAPLQNVSGVMPQYYSMLASAERLMDLENIESEPPLLESDALNTIKIDFNKICADKLAFAYNDELILKNCSFEIPKGAITAITGESGSGKSTLFRILLGLYEPSGGSITFNGNTPIDASTRRMFSYVPQGNMILSGSIRDNITLCNRKITDEQIEKATKAAAIYDYIVSLPNGFDTELSERGAGLSEGQIQRISIARALLFDAPILLLDESTSALDETTETEVLSNIKNMTDKTVIFITHRNTSIAVCDHIIHVKDKNFEMIK